MGRRTMVCRLNSSSSWSLIRAQTPSPKSVPLGTTTAARPPGLTPCPSPGGQGDGLGRRSLRMMSCRNSRAVSAVCLSSGKLPRMPRSSSPPKGGLVRITSTRSWSPISLSGNRRLFSGSICGLSSPCSSRFIWPSRYGQRLGLAAEDALLLEDLAVLDGLALLGQVVVRLDQEAARAAGGVEDGFAQPRVDHLDHEADHGPRRVELAVVAGRVAHLLEHRLVEVAEGEELLLGGEVDAADLVDDIAQQVAGGHAVDDAAERRWR